MFINKCWKCMEDMGDSSVCPKCGFKNEEVETSPLELRPNTILKGKYLVGNALGQGGFGITYIAYDLVLQMKVAIKEYFPMQEVTRNSRESNEVFTRPWGASENWKKGSVQFLSEARKMAKINAIPEIVSVRDTFEENNTSYIVMDYVPGKTLKDYVKENGCMTFTDCVNLLLPLISGLDEVHRQGIIHQDISPDNLMVSPEGKVYLLDLGAAKDMKASGEYDVSASKRGFSPLEQEVSKGEVGPWTDVYALAATIYYCVYGKVVPNSIERAENDTLSFQHKTKKALSKKQIEVMKKGLAVQKEMRYKYASDFYNALKECIKSGVNKKLVAAVAGVASIAVLAVAGWQLAIHKPWFPHIEERGAVNCLNFPKLARVNEQYEYFVDLDGSLVQVVYDEEDETFYIDQQEVVFAQDEAVEDDYVDTVELIGDIIYFCYEGGKDQDGNKLPSYVYSMNLDGSNQQVIFEIEKDYMAPRYVKLSNGKEYFYYLMDDGVVEDEESEEPEYHVYMYRYDMQKDTVEQVIEEEMTNYVLFDQYIYYMIWNEEAFKYETYRTTLDGKNKQFLDDTYSYWFGVAVDDQLYFARNTDKSGDYNPGLIACDEDAQPLKDRSGNFNIDWSNIESYAIGENWIYYYIKESGELKRVRFDGSNESVIHEGYVYYNLCYANGYLYFQDGYYDEEDEFSPYQAYFVTIDGSYIVSCGFEKAQSDAQGVQYVITDGEAQIVGYTGKSLDVVIPLTFEGYPVNTKVSREDIEAEHVDVSEIIFYAEMPASDLTYAKYEDGVMITGYTGVETSQYASVAIPKEIDGLPVIKIGDEAFAGETFSRVYLQEGIEEIGEEAFYECNSLKKVIFPDTLISIESYAFADCAFEGVDIVFPDSLESLGRGVLAWSETKSVYIPASFHLYDSGFLHDCSGEYIVDPEHEDIKCEDGLIISTSGKKIYACQMDRKGSYTIPNGVEYIEDYAFYGCMDLTKVTCPETLTEIGFKAFYWTGVTSASVPQGAEGVEDAFEEGVTIQYY